MNLLKTIRIPLYLIVLITCIVTIISFVTEGMHNKEEITNFQEIAYSSNSSDEIVSNEVVIEAADFYSKNEVSNTSVKNQSVTKVVDIKALQDANPDIFAWITIPGTTIDYPIAQHPKNDEYYLKHDANGLKSNYGCPYIELCDAKSLLEFNTVVYGHNMNNGSMFGGLHKFEDKNFYDKHRQVLVYTADHVFQYEIFAAVLYSDDYIPYCYDDSKDADRLTFIDSLKTKSLKGHKIISSDVIVNTNSNIITLSTCDKKYRNNRYLVVAVMKQIDGQDV